MIAGGIVLLAFVWTLAAVYYVATGRAGEALWLAILGTAATVVILTVRVLVGKPGGRRPKATKSPDLALPLLMFLIVLLVSWKSKPAVGFIQLCAQVIPVL